jgi:hypothetical protein
MSEPELIYDIKYYIYLDILITQSNFHRDTSEVLLE